MNTNQNHIGWSFWLQWAIATTVGFIIGGAITGVRPDYGNVGRIMAYVSGFASLILPGFVQWLALRKQIQQSGWWVLAQCLSILAGTGAAFPVMLVVGRASGWNFPSAQAWGFAGVLAGLIYGAITGAVMIRLLQQPKSFSSARTALQDA